MYLKVKLNVGDRMMTLSILPKEGNIITIRLIRELISKLGLRDTELEQFEVKQTPEGLMFNEKGREQIEFEMSEVETELIRGSLKELDSKNKLIPDMIPIWEKFC